MEIPWKSHGNFHLSCLHPQRAILNVQHLAIDLASKVLIVGELPALVQFTVDSWDLLWGTLVLTNRNADLMQFHAIYITNNIHEMIWICLQIGYPQIPVV